MLVNLENKLHNFKGGEIKETVGEVIITALNIPIQGLKKEDIIKRNSLIKQIAISKDIDFDLDELKLVTDCVSNLTSAGHFINIIAELYDILDISEKKVKDEQ